MSVDVKDLQKLAQQLQDFRSKAVRYAARNGCTEMAFQARSVWVDQIQQKMVLRNRWTTGSLRVEKAKLGPLDATQSKVGSIAPYMAAQEEGASRQTKGHRAIPTSAAAGQKGAKPRTKLVRRPNQLRAIQLAARATSGTRAQRNAISLRQAIAAGKKFAFFDLPSGRGLFAIRGTKRPKVDMIWSLRASSPKVPKNPTLGPTVTIVEQRGTKIFYDALVHQAKLAKMLGY